MTTPIQLAIPSTGGEAGETRIGPLVPVSAEAGPLLLFTGDFCPGSDPPVGPEWVAPDRDGVDPFLLSLTRSVDLSIANLECPLGRGTGPRKAGPRLWADPAWAATLASCGIGAVSLANNHAMDQGVPGLTSTLAALSDAGVLHFGAGRDIEEASRPLVVRVRDRTAAILGCAEHEFGSARRNAPGVAPLDPTSALARIRSARESCDIVVVLVHGGNETYALPRPGLRDTCRFLVDCGADSVLCCHSHTVGPIEWYAGAPIAYGLGNLYFPWHAPEQPDRWTVSLCVVLEFGTRVGLHVVPARFEEGRQGVAGLSTAETSRLARELETLSSQVVDDEALERAWASFVREHRRSYLSALLALSRAERFALRAGIWPSWRVPRGRLPELLNVVRCESHREALIRLLEDENRGE